MRRLPPLNALRVFEECARALSFSAAAQTLCVTHSAVSHQIRQLEEWFGQKLFIRHAGGIALTLSGETLQRTASQVLSQLEQTCAQLCQRPPRQELVIAAPASFLANWLIPRLELFEQAHPDIQLRLQTNARPEALLSGTVDLLIQSSSQLLPDSILSLPLLVERTGPVCAPDWHPQPRSAEALAALPRLHTASHPAAWQEWAQAQSISFANMAQGRALDHLSLMLEAAASGLGIAIAPDLLVERELGRGRLIAPLGFIATGYHFALGILATRQEEPELKTLCGWLTQQAHEAEPQKRAKQREQG